jgi:micrococcal nuclease
MLRTLLQQLKSWRIPGFRSGRAWKQIVAVLGYVIIAAWVLQALTGRPGLAAFGVAVLLTVFVSTNAWNLRARLPLVGSGNRAAAVAGWGVMALVLLSTWSWSYAEAATTSSSSASSRSSGRGGVGGGTLASASLRSQMTPTPTAVPTAPPTPKPTPTPAPPSASPAPVQATQVPPTASVNFVNAPLTARPGQATTLIARTSPNTGCTIEVDYKSGPSHAQGLVPKTSDAGGNVAWTWVVGTRTTPGQWPIYVTCGSARNQTYINVT